MWRNQGPLVALFRDYFSKRGAYRAAFYGSDHGRRCLADLMAFCGVWETSVRFSDHGYDSHATAHAEGRREVALEIIRWLKLTEEDLMRLQEEAERE